MVNTKKYTEMKAAQLGMNPSTAQQRLLKDILFKFVSESHSVCFHCGKEMSRDDFTIEHKTPWLHSDNPVELFFDLNNISFSHHCCNTRAARRNKSSSKSRRWEKEVRIYDPEKRRQQYLRTGK